MRIRTIDRSRTASSYTGIHRGEKPDGSLVTLSQWTGGSHKPYVEYQSISDEDWQPGQRVDRTRTHWCDHLKVSGQIVRKAGTFNSGLTSSYVKTHFAFSSIDHTLIKTPTLPSDSSIAQAASEALLFFAQGCTEEEVSIPLFIWELGEVRRLVDLVKSVMRLRNSDRHNLPTTEEFGVKPFVKDIVDMAKVVSGIADRLAWMRENDGKPVKVRFTKELPIGDVSSAIVPYTSGVGWYKRFTKRYCKFRAHARVRYNVRYLGDTEIRLRTLAKSLGFLNPAKVVWDHIPFSFLIDKFVDIGALLERFSLPFVYNHVVEDCGWSIKVEEEYTWYYTLKGEGFRLTDTKTCFYKRRPGLALSFSSPTFADPSVKSLRWGSRFLSTATGPWN